MGLHLSPRGAWGDLARVFGFFDAKEERGPVVDEVRTVSERLCGVKKRPVQCNYTF